MIHFYHAEYDIIPFKGVLGHRSKAGSFVVTVCVCVCVCVMYLYCTYVLHIFCIISIGTFSYMRLIGVTANECFL